MCYSLLPLRVLCSARDLFLIDPEVPFSLRSVENSHKSKWLANLSTEAENIAQL